jgi:4-hydroxy-tetrahydrodipicolinate synthase
VLYNIPARTGRNVEPETVERLSRIGRIVAVKEASGSLDQVSDLIARTDLTILSGDDSLTLPMMAVGAEGVVSVVANLVPRDVIALVDAFDRGELAEARRLHARLFPLCRDLLGSPPTPSPSSWPWPCWGAATASSGCPSSRPARQGREALRRSLARYGLLDDSPPLDLDLGIFLGRIEQVACTMLTWRCRHMPKSNGAEE